ncbi:hypothetical protein [Catenulispora pinisilvae]|uniref:hypothetical protein n=1 Tax=Catenulispora pinisilvae TaxID=2705253 RepID=UPI00189224C2|nr:hypothetical protein [Catenulispora pinisilvae]
MSDTGIVDEFVTLAAQAAAAVVSAMATDAWQGVRDTVAGLFHTSRRRKFALRARLDADASVLAMASESPSASAREAARASLLDAWTRELASLLRQDPSRREPLAELVAAYGGTPTRQAREGSRALMSHDESTRLAAVGGEALVRAMPTPSWLTARDQALAWFGRVAPDRIELYRSWLDGNVAELRDAEPAELEDVRRELVALWRRQLAELLVGHPTEAGELRRFIDRFSAAPSDERSGGKTMTNIARDHSTLFAVMDGSIHQHYDSDNDSGADSDSDAGNEGG